MVDLLHQPGPTWTVDTREQTYEHDLFESLAVESNDIFGTEVDYYILTSIDDGNADPFYGEDQNEYYSGPFKTKVTYKPTTELSMIDMFGITSQENITYAQMPKFTFNRDIDPNRDPMAGDIVYMPWNGRAYSITDVGEEENVFLARKFIWEFMMRPYKQTNVDTTPIVDEVTDTQPLSAWGDSEFIEHEGNIVDSYADLPNYDDLYGVGR
ncbi:MAG: hypothetical protein WC503_02790 [Candidatus Shapirobacteria bacterium]